MLNKVPGILTCYYQSAFYQITNFRDVVDISTTDNMVVIVKVDGSAWIMEFNPEKICGGEISPSKIGVGEAIEGVYMNYNDIFLRGKKHNVYHLQRN